MHSCKEKEGLIDRIKDFWGWLQEKGWVDHFSSISGLLSRKGIPAAGDEAWQELEAFMALFGNEKEQIPMKHLSHFTSMHSCKVTEGLIDRIKDFWGWLQEKGWVDHFSSISGLLSGKGIPAAGDEAWQDLEAFMALFGNEKEQIPIKHLSHFTSMHSGKGKEGLVDRIKDFWGWLQEKGWVDHFSSISGLLSKKGIPAAGDEAWQELEAFMALFGNEKEQIPMKHLSHFTSMHSYKGTEGLAVVVQSFWNWLDKDGTLLREAALLNSQAGIPSLPTLNTAQGQLTKDGLWDDDDAIFLRRIALHLSAPEKKRLLYSHVESFMSGESTAGRKTGAIPRLAKLLRRHGKESVQVYQDLVGKSAPSDVDKVITLFQKAGTVDLARMAVTEIFPRQGDRETSRYLYICRNLVPAPGLSEWKKMKTYIKVLCQATGRNRQDNDGGEYDGTATPSFFENNWFIQRLYIESLWTLPTSLRERFLEADAVQSLISVVRSVAALKRLSRATTGEIFQQQCQACLNTATSILTARDLQRLFQIHKTLRIPWYRQQHDSTGDFSNVSTDSSGTGILIRAGSGEKGKSLWQPFVAAVVDGLYQTDMSPAGKETINLPGDQEEMLFASPRLVFNEQGVRITNWTEEQYRLFGDALELPGFESSSAGEPEPYVAGRHDRQPCNPAVENPVDQKNLSLQLIEQLLKSAVPLRAKTWNQLENQRDHLSARILRLLSKKRHLENMPEALRDYLESYVQSGGNSQEQAAADLPPSEMAAPDFLTDFEMTGNLVDDLLQQPILKADTLQLLNAYADDLTAAQLTDIITKMDFTLSWEVRFPWLSRQANSHQMAKENLDDWSLEDWLEDNSIETVTEQEGNRTLFLRLLCLSGECLSGESQKTLMIFFRFCSRRDCNEKPSHLLILA